MIVCGKRFTCVGAQNVRTQMNERVCCARKPAETREVLELFFRKLLGRQPPPPENIPTVDKLVRGNLDATQVRRDL